MIAAVCDSNVYISAIVFGGGPRDVVVLGERAQVQLLVSPRLVSEVELVLARKFAWEQRRVRQICQPLWESARLVKPATDVSVCRDPQDNHLLALALDGEAQIPNHRGPRPSGTQPIPRYPHRDARRIPRREALGSARPGVAGDRRCPFRKFATIEDGGMAERLKAAVLKTVNGVTRSGVRIPLPPPCFQEFK